MKKIYSLLFIALLSASASAQVVISQVYGGGGNTGAIYNNDFIELYNRGTVAVSLNGWSVQYASTSGANWASTNLPNVTIQPGKYYLIQQAAGAGTPGALPTPDLVGSTCGCTFDAAATVASTTGIAMAGTNGKVILVNSTTQETTTNPAGAQIIDKVGYGSANGFEGAAATAVLSNSTAAIRNNAGCTDTNNNGADFTVGTPVARNGATATNTCNLAVGENTISGLNVYPNPVKNGIFYITTDANAERTVTVFDIVGKQVLNTTTSESAINVANLNSGVYMVQITEEGKTATKKLVIR